MSKIDGNPRMLINSERHDPVDIETDCSGCSKNIRLQWILCTLITSAFLTLLFCGFGEFNKCTPDTVKSRSTMKNCVAWRRGYCLVLTSSISTSLYLSLLESTFLTVYEVGRTMPTLAFGRAHMPAVISSHCSIVMPVIGLYLTHNGCYVSTTYFYR